MEIAYVDDHLEFSTSKDIEEVKPTLQSIQDLFVQLNAPWTSNPDRATVKKGPDEPVEDVPEPAVLKGVPEEDPLEAAQMQWAVENSLAPSLQDSAELPKKSKAPPGRVGGGTVNREAPTVSSVPVFQGGSSSSSSSAPPPSAPAAPKSTAVSSEDRNKLAQVQTTIASAGQTATSTATSPFDAMGDSVLLTTSKAPPPSKSTTKAKEGPIGAPRDTQRRASRSPSTTSQPKRPNRLSREESRAL